MYSTRGDEGSSTSTPKLNGREYSIHEHTCHVEGVLYPYLTLAFKFHVSHTIRIYIYTCIPVYIYLQSEITSRDVVKVIQGTHIVSSFPFYFQMYTCACTHIHTQLQAKTHHNIWYLCNTFLEPHWGCFFTSFIFSMQFLSLCVTCTCTHIHVCAWCNVYTFVYMCWISLGNWHVWS